MIFILIFIIALSSSIMDILKDKFNVSVFRKLNLFFWDLSISWKNKYKNKEKSQGKKYLEYLSGITDTFSDAWHIFKFIIIINIIIGFSIEKDFNIFHSLIYLLEYGIIFKWSYKLLEINNLTNIKNIINNILNKIK